MAALLFLHGGAVAEEAPAFPPPTVFTAEAKKPVKMNYWVMLPDGYETSQENWPLLLWLHGAGAHDDMEEIFEYGPPEMKLKGRNFPFILLAPQLPADVHWDPDSVHLLLQDVISRHRVDRDRVWIMGYSRGGFGTWEVACSYPDTFSAVVAISARAMVAIERIRHAGIWIFAGELDTGVPTDESRNMYQELKSVDADVQMTIFEGVGHGACAPAMKMEELWTWLVKQRKKSEAPGKQE
ncbi:MAG: prolyl oligopeptidase family serine peptidase [Candidatus Hydrogenedentes bacterium]|nr:prolyl oligopeptidase family serine peptidase [Candidatus Hydrogenedentota bacterium]